jgi:acyl carrier protein
MKLSIEKLQEIFSSAFNKQIEISLETKKEDVGEWDSLSHLNLIVELEDSLGVSFTKDEIATIKSVKDIMEIVENK